MSYFKNYDGFLISGPSLISKGWMLLDTPADRQKSIDGWQWFDTEAEARAAYGIPDSNPLDTLIQAIADAEGIVL